MTDERRAARRAKGILLAAATAMWLLFVAVAAFTGLLGRGSGALFAAFAWHALIGFAVARAFPPQRGEAPTVPKVTPQPRGTPEGAAFAVTRNALLATVASLASGFGVVFALTGGA